MDKAIPVRVGFISSSSRSNPDHRNFEPIVPKDVQMDFEALKQETADLYDVEGTIQTVVSRVEELAHQHRWQGVVVSGAPREILNPGMLQKLRATLTIPVSTAMDSSVAALKALSAKRVLLITPFDDRINIGIREYVAAAGIQAVSAPQTVPVYTDSLRLTPLEVFALTKAALEGSGPVDAVYFQGAILDPLEVIQRIEEELDTTVVASNPAMVWFILSLLGLTYQIRGSGKLLEQWPKPV